MVVSVRAETPSLVSLTPVPMLRSHCLPKPIFLGQLKIEAAPSGVSQAVNKPGTVLSAGKLERVHMSFFGCLGPVLRVTGIRSDEKLSIFGAMAQTDS